MTTIHVRADRDKIGEWAEDNVGDASFIIIVPDKHMDLWEEPVEINGETLYVTVTREPPK